MEEILKPTEDELMAAEEKCRKAIKTVAKAVFMRLFVTGLREEKHSEHILGQSVPSAPFLPHYMP